VTLIASDFAMPIGAAPKEDGTFTLDSVSPAKYRLILRPPPGAYVQSVVFGRQDVAHGEIDMSQGAAGDLDVTLRYGTAEVDGMLNVAQNAAMPAPDGQTAPPPVMSIALIPSVPNPDGSGLEFGNTDQSGAFAVRNVPPGAYRALALEHIDLQQLQNPELQNQLLGMGTEVEVKENEKKQIQLTPISSSDLQTVFARLGIDAQ
jgi:hypothetical protein